MQINLIDKSNAKLIHEVLNKHLAAAAAELGMQLKNSGARFSPTSISKKVEFLAISGEAVEITTNKAKMEFELFAPTVLKDSFGKLIKLGNDQYRIAGFNPGASKNCISIKRVRDDKAYRCGADTALLGLQKMAA